MRTPWQVRTTCRLHTVGIVPSRLQAARQIRGDTRWGATAERDGAAAGARAQGYHGAMPGGGCCGRERSETGLRRATGCPTYRIRSHMLLSRNAAQPAKRELARASAPSPWLKTSATAPDPFDRACGWCPRSRHITRVVVQEVAVDAPGDDPLWADTDPGGVEPEPGTQALPDGLAAHRVRFCPPTDLRYRAPTRAQRPPGHRSTSATSGRRCASQNFRLAAIFAPPPITMASGWRGHRTPRPARHGACQRGQPSRGAERLAGKVGEFGVGEGGHAASTAAVRSAVSAMLRAVVPDSKVCSGHAWCAGHAGPRNRGSASRWCHTTRSSCVDRADESDAGLRDVAHERAERLVASWHARSAGARLNLALGVSSRLACGTGAKRRRKPTNTAEEGADRRATRPERGASRMNSTRSAPCYRRTLLPARCVVRRRTTQRRPQALIPADRPLAKP